MFIMQMGGSCRCGAAGTLKRVSLECDTERLCASCAQREVKPLAPSDSWPRRTSYRVPLAARA